MKLIMERYRKNVGGSDVSLEDKFKKIEEFKLSSLNPMNWFNKGGSPYSDKMNLKWWSMNAGSFGSGVMKSSWKDHPIVAQAFIDFKLSEDPEHIRKVAEWEGAYRGGPLGDTAKAKIMRHLKRKSPLAVQAAFEILVVERWNNLQQYVPSNHSGALPILDLLSELSSAQILCEVKIKQWEKDPGGLGSPPFKDQFKEVARIAKDYSGHGGNWNSPDYGEGPYGYLRDRDVAKGKLWAQDHLKKLDEKFERDKEIVELNRKYFTSHRSFLSIDSLEDMITELDNYATELEDTYGYDGLKEFGDKLGLDYKDFESAREDSTDVLKRRGKEIFDFGYGD